MNAFWFDLTNATRALRRSPYVAAVAALSIGLAVGAVSAVFSWMDALVLHPFPAVPSQERLVGVEVGPPNGGMGAWSYQSFKELRDGTHLFTGLAAWRIIRVSTRAPGEDGSVPLLATPVSGGYFSVLGVTPVLGRVVNDADVDASAPVAVLGHQYWLDRFHGDPAAIGATLLLNGQALTIIGVAPAGFAGVYTGVVPQFYVPITLQPRLSGTNALDDRKLRSWLIFGRLSAGTSLEAARADVDAVAKRISLSYGDRPPTGAVSDDLRIEFLGRTLSPLLVALLWVSALLVVLASANVASLLLVRGDARRGEIALRRALGAPTWRVVRMALFESSFVAAAGGLVALAIAYLARGGLYSFVPRGTFPISLPIPIGWRVFGMSLVIVVGVAIVCGVAPAIAGTRVSAQDSLRSGRATSGRTGLRSAIVIGQVALCIVSLMLAGMFTRALRTAAAVDVGFRDPSHVLLVDTDFGSARVSDTSGATSVGVLLTRLRALPGVQSATVASMVPLGFGGRRVVEMKVEGHAPAPNENMSAERAHVGSDYAATMKIRVVRGRDLRDDDREGSLPVALVNEAFVKQFFGGADPMGRRIDAGRGWATIVGVLHDGKYDRLDEPLHPVVYVPMSQWFLPGMTLHVRTAGNPRALAEPVRSILRSINVDLPALQARTLAEHISASTFVPRTGALIVAAFAAVALLLSIVGLYGALAFSVALRGREIAVRLALGARVGAIAWSVARRALAIAGVGSAIGGVMALIGGGLLRARISNVAPADPLVGIGAAFVLLIATAIATWVPARSATRVDPATALRGE